MLGFSVEAVKISHINLYSVASIKTSVTHFLPAGLIYSTRNNVLILYTIGKVKMDFVLQFVVLLLFLEWMILILI